ncbi:MAG: ribonuclease P protein component [Oscillospiraceae bacterium]|jgi:ribonuclease P protein component|nr:ribonuclease P protein component [Oscillospiraceae bacterium]
MKNASMKLNGEFKRCYGRAKVQGSAIVVTYAVRGKTPRSRFGITTSKRIGNAVQRNRARRILKEALRTMEEPLRGSWDIVLVAKEATVRAKMPQVRRVIEGHLRKVGALRDPNAQNGTAPPRRPASPPGETS